LKTSVTLRSCKTHKVWRERKDAASRRLAQKGAVMKERNAVMKLIELDFDPAHNFANGA
jgi:hypothetical protein